MSIAAHPFASCTFPLTSTICVMVWRVPQTVLTTDGRCMGTICHLREVGEVGEVGEVCARYVRQCGVGWAWSPETRVRGMDEIPRN